MKAFFDSDGFIAMIVAAAIATAIDIIATNIRGCQESTQATSAETAARECAPEVVNGAKVVVCRGSTPGTYYHEATVKALCGGAAK